MEGPESRESIPEGFAPHFRRSPLTDPWEPLYSRRTADAVVIGLRLAKVHTNSRGYAHGGLISALADNAMGLSCGAKLGETARGLLTVSLSVDFVGRAAIGDWLTFETNYVKPGEAICFAQSFVKAGDQVVARASATFRVQAAA